MQDTKEDKSPDAKDDKKGKDPKKPVSVVTYMLGFTAKVSWILILSTTTLLTTALMTLTKPHGKGWRDREKMVEWLGKPVEWIKQQNKNFSNRTGGKLEGFFTVLTASFVFAHFLRRLIEIPALHRGRTQAREINQKFSDLTDERDALLDKLAKYEGEEIYNQHPQSAPDTTQRPSQVPSQPTSPLTNMQKPASPFPSPGTVPPLGEVHIPTTRSPMDKIGGIPAQLTHTTATPERQDSPTLTGAGV